MKKDGAVILPQNALCKYERTTPFITTIVLYNKMNLYKSLIILNYS